LSGVKAVACHCRYCHVHCLCYDLSLCRWTGTRFRVALVLSFFEAVTLFCGNSKEA